MLESYKFAFDISEFGCAYYYILNDNGKTKLLENRNVLKLRSIVQVITNLS